MEIQTEKSLTMPKKNICHRCPEHYGCREAGVKPPIGECTVIRSDKRKTLLMRMADILKKQGIVFLRQPVEVTEDYCGCDFAHTVRKISLPASTNPEGLDFCLGTSSYGESVWTKNLSTKDIERIEKQMH